MKVPQLLDQVRQRVPEKAAIGTRFKVTAVVETPYGTHDIAVAARIDAEGRRREQFWCDAVRVQQPVLLRLTCPEGQCPHVVQVRAQWASFHRNDKATTRPRPLQPQPLIAETTIKAGGQSFAARPGRFPCFTRCPNGAHPPMTIEKSGFDLFDDSGCVGGGVTEAGGIRRPRLATLREAEAYALARRLEALAAVGHAHDASRSRPGRTTGDD